jgi:hypothetical protein
MNDDVENLRLLSIFHAIVAGLTGLFALFPIFHLVFGILAVSGHLDSKTQSSPFPALIGWFFIAFASIWIVSGLMLATCVLLSGLFIAKRKRYTFCFVVACVMCAFMPFGTILGVFTILVLQRPSVKALFGRPISPLAPGGNLGALQA